MTVLNITLNFEGANILSPICSELQKLAGRNHVTTLTLALFISASSEPPEDNWNLLEGLLLADGWSSLRQFNLNVRIITWKQVDFELPQSLYEDEFIKVHETQLLGLATTKLLKYNFTMTRGFWSLEI